ncbi:hypothetical protein [Halostagnicola sp. A-GB9-2]|uniref:hypothetical protein n=1 Tax=Halostagnicola sp. A-GB9-2 TaxID=3048066 RepID=UPI0024BF1E70|nr:hypothetical protein [Halostagnicola sp. A-GB9-2]MDJ1431152.1 hypothetical protein [Halostagnicola sp. A-GB9-2]
MSAENTDTESNIDDEDELPGNKKERLVALHVLDIDDEITNKEAATITGASEEYARQVLNSLDGKEGYEKADTEDIERVSDNQELLDAISERTIALGILDETDPEDTEEQTIEEPDTMPTSTTAKATASTGPVSATSALDELEELVSVMDVLEREADAAGDSGRAFVAQEARSRAEAALNALTE